MPDETHVPKIKLTSRVSIPQVGFGLWQIKDKAECINSIHDALEAGYRHFDTAQVYGNEQYLGEALAAAALPRESVFITTKIGIKNFIKVENSFDDSLTKLRTGYVDLLLLHFPMTGLRRGAWKKLESIHKAGKARSIGVSNYTVRHLTQLLEYASVKPVVNQVELHVFLQQPELLEFCKRNGIAVEAYSPLAHGQGMDDPDLDLIAKKHHKSPAQIMLRWCIDMGTIPLPKSVTPERIKQNIDIFDFELDAGDLEIIAGLERGLRTCRDPSRTP